MARPLSLILVEDDPKSCENIVSCVSDYEDIFLAGVTNNENKALELVNDCAPDAMILDLELHQGCGNGLHVLAEMQHMDMLSRPYVLVTTHNSSNVTYDAARALGADFIMSKHQQDYSAKTVIDFLRVMKPIIQSRVNEERSQAAEDEEYRQKRIPKKICAELDRVGISPKMIGYQYLLMAIQITIDNPSQNLCSLIAKDYGKTEASVERAMQNAINKAWHTADIEDLMKFYTAKINSDRGVPTITEFIWFYANKIKHSA